MTESLLRLKTVRERVGFSRSKIYSLIAKAQFPEPIQLGARAVAWPSSEIDRWVFDRVASPRQKNTPLQLSKRRAVQQPQAEACPEAI